VSHLPKAEPPDKAAGNLPALRDLLTRAAKGDETTVPLVRELLAHSNAPDEFGADLAKQIERALVNARAGEDLFYREVLLKKLADMRAELAGPSPTPLEGLLVRRVVTCWLHLHDIELRLVQARGLTVSQAEHKQRSLDRAHRRFLSAIKALAAVRRLAMPVLLAQVNVAGQMNVGQQRVNTAGGGA
jgi:hypothetical protein